MIECFVPSAGAQLFCRVRGEGEPLLLIHGAVCDSDFLRMLRQLWPVNSAL